MYSTLLSICRKVPVNQKILKVKLVGFEHGPAACELNIQTTRLYTVQDNMKREKKCATYTLPTGHCVYADDI